MSAGHFLQPSSPDYFQVWKWVAKNDTSSPSHAVGPAGLCDGNESLIFQLIAASVEGWKSELDFLWACASLLVGFVSNF